MGALPGQVASGVLGDVYVRKYDSEGAELWTQQFGSPVHDVSHHAATDVMGNVFIVGSTWGSLPGQISQGGIDGFVRKYDSDGTEGWTWQFGTSAEDQAMAIALCGSDRAYVVGFTDGVLDGQDPLGSQDAFLIRLQLG